MHTASNNTIWIERALLLNLKIGHNKIVSSFGILIQDPVDHVHVDLYSSNWERRGSGNAEGERTLQKAIASWRLSERIFVSRAARNDWGGKFFANPRGKENEPENYTRAVHNS